MVERCGNFVKMYTKYGIAILSKSESLLEYFYNQEMIDNLTYVEAVYLLRKIIKENQNARHGPNCTVVEKDSNRLR